MRNKKGFTLAELLIAITVIGIILAVAIPALTSINRKDIETQERIYEESLVTAAKMFNDSYSEDTFGGKKNGCVKIPYSKLEDKDLIKNLESNKLDCDYKDGDEDVTGLIVRKVNKRYYYETIMWCRNKSTGKEEQVSGNVDEKLYDIDDDYCDETAAEDNDPPVVHYTNTNPRFYYNSGNYPKPKVWVTDSGVGLVNDVSVTIDWEDPIGGNSSITRTFHPGMGNNLAKKSITLPGSITTSDTTGQYKVTVKTLNVQDMVGNVLEAGTLAVAETPDGLSTSKVVTNPEAFYIENSNPSITTPVNKSWTNQVIPVTLSVTDDDGKVVYSGIKSFKYTVKNNSSGETIKSDADCGSVSTEAGITKNNPKNSAHKSKSCSFSIGRGEYTGGSYTVTTRAEDWSGNEKTSTNSYEFDNQAPSITITRLAYNRYKWEAYDNGYSGLNGYVHNNSSTRPTDGWTTGSTTSGTRNVGNAGTYYTHVRDKAGNYKYASIPAYAVTRSVGEGTTLSTKYETSSGTSFTNNPVVFNNTPIYVRGALQAGYGSLVVKFAGSTISNNSIHNVVRTTTISTSATKCSAGRWNNGSYATCQACPTGYTSDAGARSQNECYINVEAGKYKTTSTGTSKAACGTGTYKGAHRSYYNSSDSCTSCPSGYTDGAGTTAQSNCIKRVAVGKRVATARGAESACANGYYKAAHNVHYGGTSSCTQCPEGYRNGGPVGAESGCAKSVPAGKKVATARGAETGCGNGYYRAAHTVTYGNTSSCTQCPSGYRNGGAAGSESGCAKSVPAGKKVATARGAETGCGDGYYKGAHTVTYGNTSSCTQCPSGYRNGGAAGSESGCVKSVSCGHHVSSAKGGAVACGKGYYRAAHTVTYGSTSSCTSCGSGKTTDSTTSCNSSDCKSSYTRIKLCRIGNTCINCYYGCDYADPYGTEYNAVSDGDSWKIVGGNRNGCRVYKNCVGATACPYSQCPG